MQQRPMTVEDLWSMERLGAPEVSPDGRWAVLSITVYNLEDNRPESDLWLVDLDPAMADETGDEPRGAAVRRLTWNKGSDQGAVWSPDGRWLAFVAKRDEDGPAQLYRLPLAGGEAEPLTELATGVQGVRWLPDGRGLVFLAATFPDLNDDFEAVKERVEAQKDDKTQVRASDRRLVRYWDQYRTDGRVPHAFRLDLESRETRDLMPGFDALVGFRGVEWDLAPDGKELAFAANTSSPPWRDLDLKVHRLDLERGELQILEPGSPIRGGGPRYSEDGRYLLFGRTHRPRVSADFTRLARFDRQSGEIRELTAGWDAEPGGWRTTRDGETVVFYAHHRGRLSLYALPIDGGTPRLLVEGGSASGLAPGAGRRLVFLTESMTRPEELASIDLGETQGVDAGLSIEPQVLTTLHDERLAELDLGQVDDVTFTGADGDPVQMWVVKPPGFDPGTKWPLVVLLHGGPHSAWLDAFHYRWSAPLFAAQGWVVAAVNFHGSTGFGQAFAESILGDQAERPFTDVMRAVDHLLAEGWVDEERLAAAGGSYGGYLVAWLMGHTDRFRAVVDHAGVYDLMAQFASDYTWHRETSYGAAPWVDPAVLDRQSPSRFAGNFNTPTLILHGELDYRVPVTQALNLHHVLIDKGVRSRIVIFPRENHWIRKPQAARIWWREVLDWLASHLGTDPA